MAATESAGFVACTVAAGTCAIIPDRCFGELLD